MAAVATYPLQIALQRMRSTPDWASPGVADEHAAVLDYVRAKEAQGLESQGFENRMELAELRREATVGEREASREFKSSEFGKEAESARSLQDMRLDELQRRFEDKMAYERDVLGEQATQSKWATLAGIGNLGLSYMKGKAAISEADKVQARENAILTMHEKILDLQSTISSVIGGGYGEMVKKLESAYKK